MQRFLFTITAVTLTTLFSLGTSPQASAQPGPKNIKAAVTHGKTGPANLANARSHVRGFRGWSSYCWLPSYRCYGYYCTADGLWFYWCGSLNRFMPISFLTMYPPTPLAGVNPGLPGPGTTIPLLPPGATPVQNAPRQPDTVPVNPIPPMDTPINPPA